MHVLETFLLCVMTFFNSSNFSFVIFSTFTFWLGMICLNSYSILFTYYNLLCDFFLTNDHCLIFQIISIILVNQYNRFSFVFIYYYIIGYEAGHYGMIFCISVLRIIPVMKASSKIEINNLHFSHGFIFNKCSWCNLFALSKYLLCGSVYL